MSENPNNTSDKDDDCVSKKSWSEVLNRALKLFMFNAVSESGRSIGKSIIYVVMGLVVLGVGTYALNSFTGWFSGLFDFWPFGGGEDVQSAVTEEESSGWFGWGASGEEPTPQPAPVAEDGENTPWYCKWNPIC